MKNNEVLIASLIGVFCVACSPPRSTYQMGNEVPPELMPLGFEPQDCHFEQPEAVHESAGASAEDFRDAMRASAESNPHRKVRCVRKKGVIHTAPSCVDATGQERPHEYCKEHGAGGASPIAIPEKDKLQGTSAQPHLVCGGPNGIIRHCDEDD